jgi:LacI family transcriptional regulator
MHSPRLAFLTGEIARSIHAAGLEFAAVSDQRTGTQRPQKTLEKLTAQYPGSVWILFGSNAPTQKWFAERRIPALLLGSCFSKGLLHSIDQDMRATCRHAAGQMLALGHERLGLFLPSGKLAGDLASIEGAREAVAMHKGRAELILIEHDRTVPGQKRAVLAMLRTKRQPSGLIICGPDAALACVPVLLASGVRIPSDLSVICRESEAYLDAFGIDLNRYRINEVSLSQKLAHRAVMLAKEAASPPSSLLVQPDYHHGSSLAPPRKNLG